MRKSFAFGLLVSTACSGDLTFSDRPRVSETPADVSLEEAIAIVERVADLYRPQAQVLGAELIVVNDPATGTSIDIGEDRRWVIKAGEDLLRPGKTPPDVVAMIACHEVGHALAGYPFKGNFNQAAGLPEQFGTISSAENQSDYFAAKDCLPRLWRDERARNASFADAIPDASRAGCDAAWGGQDERDVCYRVTATAQAFAFWLAKPGQTPASLESHHAGEIDVTSTSGHVSPQCRIDTLVAGARCDIKIHGDVIPGLVAPFADLYKQVNPRAEAAARPHACYEGAGARPRCWFKPDMVAHDCSGVPAEGRCISASEMEYCTEAFGVEIIPCEGGCKDVAAEDDPSQSVTFPECL
jgi:hypothetical protein